MKYIIFSRLNTVVFSEPDPERCGGTWTDSYLVGNFSSSAQFFVTLAVLVLLYCIAALVVYVGYKHMYQHNSKFPLTVSNTKIFNVLPFKNTKMGNTANTRIPEFMNIQ